MIDNEGWRHIRELRALIRDYDVLLQQLAPETYAKGRDALALRARKAEVLGEDKGDDEKEEKVKHAEE